MLQLVWAGASSINSVYYLSEDGMKEYILTVTERVLYLIVQVLMTGVRNPIASNELIDKLREQSLQVVNNE